MNADDIDALLMTIAATMSSTDLSVENIEHLVKQHPDQVMTLVRLLRETPLPPIVNR